MLTVSAAEPVPLAGVTESQAPPVAVVAVAVNGVVVAEAVSWTVCGAAVVEAPITWLKLSVVGAAVMVCAGTTLTVTGTVIGLPDAPAEVIVTVPVYCPGVSDPALTATETLEVVVPLAGVAVSHVPPPVAAAAAV